MSDQHRAGEGMNRREADRAHPPAGVGAECGPPQAAAGEDGANDGEAGTHQAADGGDNTDRGGSAGGSTAEAAGDGVAGARGDASPAPGRRLWPGRWLDSWRIEGGGLLALALLAVLLFLQRHPYRLPAEEAEQPAIPLQPATRPAATDVALILSWPRISAHALGLFSSRDWSAWWLNLLEQEVGPFSLLPAESFRPEEIEGRRVVVVSASAWPVLSQTGRLVLQTFLDRGGVVVGEGPLARELTGPGLIQLASPSIGELVAAQQGWHGEAMVLRSSERFPGLEPGMIQPHALLPSGSPGVVMEPQADRQERACWARIEQQVPIPRWWYHPHAAAGVVALTHDEEGFGDRSRWMAEHEGSQLLRSTMFVIPGAMTAGGAMSILAEGADVQLHWNRGFFAQYVEQRLGFGPFRPLVRTRSLREQKEALLGLLPPSGQAVLLNRNHGLVWDPEWGKSFRILAAAGIAADSTYGPTGAGRFGYIFGTGLPFSPLDENGLPLPLHEVPFLFQDDEEYSIARQVELLERSEQGDHQLIVAIFHVNTMARVPSLERMHGWLELPRQARQHAHQVMDLGSFLRFWWDRARSPIRSSYQQGKLSIEVQALVEGLTLRLPERADGSTLWAIVVDGDRFPVAWAVRYAGAVLIPLSPGRHVLEVHYR